MKEEPGTRLIDYLPDIEGSPGLVVNEATAKVSPCTCYRVDETEMCFSKGVIGTLTKEQIGLYCPQKFYKTQGLVKRVKGFKEGAAVCKVETKKYPKGERLKPWLECMGREAGKRSIEL